MSNVLLGSQLITKKRQGHDRCWSGTGLESPVSDFALSLPAPADTDTDTDLMQNVQSVKETSEQTRLGSHSQLVHFLENNELT